MQKITYLLLAILGCATARGVAGDWPQWLGPQRNGISSETGLLQKWPASGPQRLWIFKGLGHGYASPAIVGDRVYITGSRDKTEILFALDKQGREVWQTPYGPMWTRNFPASRTCPTHRDGKLYVVSSLGKVVCLEASTGKIAWQVDMKKALGARDITWGITESPLVVGDKVLCTPGGDNVVMAALNRHTGDVIWKTSGLSDKSAYCSPLLVQRGNRAIAVTVMSHHIVGVDIADGALLWSHPYKGQCSAHANTPVYHDGVVYITSGYNMGGVALTLNADGSAITEKWTDKVLDVHHGGVVLLDGCLYGSNWNGNSKGDWICLDWETGKTRYKEHWLCKGSITAAEGMLYCYEEKGGTLGLVKATPSGFRPISTFKVTHGDGKHWAHPVVCGGQLYVRHGDALAAYDIKAR